MDERGKITDKMRNQFRSWSIMQEYFGIEQPGTIFYTVDWRKILPPDQVNTMDDIIEKSHQREIERIKLN